MTRDPKYELEREQALKMIRAFVDYSNGIALPHSLVSLLVSLAELPDDKLRTVILETLAELGSITIVADR